MRLFVALLMNSEICRELGELQRRLRPFAESLKFSDCNSSHLTLKFLGEASEEALPELKSALSRAAARASVFGIRLGNCGTFPEHGEARVVWTALAESAALTALASDLESSLTRLGYESEPRPFATHITIARVKRPLSSAELRAKVQAMHAPPHTQQINHFSLIESVLHPTGPVYTELERFELGSRP